VVNLKAKKGETPVLALPTDRRDREKLIKVVEQAAQVIRKGGVVIIPTETSYALAADATNEAAVKKVIELKAGKVEKRGISIIVSDLRMAQKYAKLNNEAEFLAQSFMPGPLTLIVDKQNLPDCLSESGVAFSISSNITARLLAQESEVPLTGTGAHPAGEAPIYKIDEIKKHYDHKVDLIIDAGNLVPVMPSTVIDMRENPPQIIREGPLSSKEILSQLDYFKKRREGH